MTERPMAAETRRLLDGLSGADRGVIMRLALEEHSPLMSRLFRAVAAQLISDDFHEARVLQAHEREHRAYLDEVDQRVNGDPPAAEGIPCWFDPGTGEWMR